MTTAPAIVINDLSFAYEAVPVLTGVNLTVDADDFICVVGPNGGGKTTLIKLMLGLLKPDSGVIRIFGEAPEKARSGIGYVPQYFQFDTSFPMKVIDVVLMGRLDRHTLFGHYTRADRAAAIEALNDVGLSKTRDHPFAALSGGQRQRALIARALASAPKLFFLDEPTANIDPAMQDELYDLLRELNRRLTILVVSHDIGVVSSLVQRVVCVNRSVWVHPTSELTGETIFNIYGHDVSMVRHDHRCAEQGHETIGAKSEEPRTKDRT